MVFHLGRMVKPCHTHLVIWFSHLILLRQASLVPVVATVVSSPSSPPCCVLERAVHLLPTGRTGAGSWRGENLWSPRGQESYLPKNPLCEDVMSTTNHKEWRCAKPTWWVDQHMFKARHRCQSPSKWGQKNRLGQMTNARWITSSLIMIPQMMGIGKLTGLKYRPGPIRPPTPEVKGTSLRPPIRPRCATSPGFQVQGFGGAKAVSWVGKWSFKSGIRESKNVTKCWWLLGRMPPQAVRPATFSPLSYTTESWKVDL